MKLCLVCNFQFEDEQDLCPKDLSKLVPVGKDPLIGKLIQDKYRIESLVAKGSMGVIYKATQELIGREVAIKVMHSYLVSDEESLKRYYKEAKASSRLNHPHIITIYDFGVLSSGQPYIVMDLLQGKALSDILHARGQLTLKQTLMVFQQCCLALGEAHKRGVVHRDIKPENIVIDEMPDGKSINVKVVDFGIATFAADTNDTLGKITKTGTVCGSPFYMSPEQCDASGVDARSDLYSLGIVLFECLTGKVPFDSKDIYQVMTMQVKDQPPSLQSIRPDLAFSSDIEDVVCKSLAKDPANRFQSADDFWNTLALAAGVKTVSAQKPPQLAKAISNEKATHEQQSRGTSQKTATNTLPETANEPAEPLPATQERAPLNTDDLKKKVRAKTLNMNKSENPASARRKKRKMSVSLLDRIIGLLQIIGPPLMTIVVTVLLFWVVANESMIHTLIKKSKAVAVQESPATDNSDIEALMAKNKLNQARKILENKKRNSKLSEQDQENLNWIYIRLARKEAKAKHFKQAIAILEQGSPDMKEQEEVKILLKRFKKQLSKP